MSSARITWIDTARGIGILLVVLFHYPSINEIVLYRECGGVIQTAYMPFFIMLSGLFFSVNNPRKRLRRLIIPLAFFYTIGCGIAVIRDMMKSQPICWSEILQPLWGKPFNYPCQPLWFLLALTEIFVMSFLLVRFFGKRIAFLLSFILCLVGYVVGIYCECDFYYISVALLCIPFYLGASHFSQFLKKDYPWWLYTVSGVVAIVMFTMNPYACNVSMNDIPLSLFEFLFISISFGFTLLGLSKLCNRNHVLSCILAYFGKNSLIVLCTHILFVNTHTLVWRGIHNYTIAVLISLPLILLMEYLVIESINHYAPFALGNK